MVRIRFETTDDDAAVRRVNEEAFGRAEEARLVEALRRSARPQLSLVAEEDGAVVGHIFFSPVTIESQDAMQTALGLAPMAVLPTHQRRGIGSRLVESGLEECKRLGHFVVVVLGHPEYYPRFGFRPAREKGLACEFEVPDEAFMVVELKEGALEGQSGVVKYLPEFSEV